MRRWRATLVAVVCALAVLAGCGKGALAKKEYVWVSAPQVRLRDRVAALYNPVATAKNGDRLEVLDRQKRFYKVRTDAGQEGWVEQRYTVTEEIYDGFQKLASENAKTPAQGRGITRNQLNIHLTPARDSEHLFQLKDGEQVELLKRGTGEKPTTRGAIASRPVVRNAAEIRSSKDASEAKAGQKGAVKPSEDETPAAVLEDWWLIRDSQKHVGWVLARMIDLDVPLDVAQYAEGQRIVGAYVLDTLNDPGYEPKQDDSDLAESSGSSDAQSNQAATPAPGGTAAAKPDYHIRPQYLMLLTEPKDGLPFDYNQARVFTWNVKRHRYETAYRERNLFGVLPVTVGKEDFDKEGVLPTFTLRVKDDAGNVIERKYKLNQPIVRLVTAPGQQPQHLARPEKREKRAAAARRKHRR